ncbi:MAG TPA: FRG domain-containing protein [Rhizomicrobium sp.]|nr:FRG domain-containing protein [Rhizomicrobium sp.]
MVHGTNLKTWEDFKTELAQLRRKQESNSRLQRRLYFRGQADSRWGLATTLERHTIGKTEFIDYYRTISVLQAELEAFTENSWQIPDYAEVCNVARSYDEFSRRMTFGQNPAYEYMAHLRHHGFPSPLLDWTRSEYIAAYFAFRETHKNENASIYVLSESNTFGGSSRTPRIHRFGPNVKTHRRHFLQQCEYTMCLGFDEDNGAWCFSPHDQAFKTNEEFEETPFNSTIYKFNIASSERAKVLKSLDEHNLNAFSLFGSEESLMETLTLREYLYA